MNADGGTAIDMKVSSKLLGDGILSYVKAVVRLTAIKSLKANQGSNHLKEVEQDPGSHKAGDIRRPNSILPGHDERFTSPRRSK